jgi:hypothetical protein
MTVEDLLVTTAAEETTLVAVLPLHVLEFFVSWWRSRCREAAAVVEADIVAMAMVSGRKVKVGSM